MHSESVPAVLSVIFVELCMQSEFRAHINIIIASLCHLQTYHFPSPYWLAIMNEEGITL